MNERWLQTVTRIGAARCSFFWAKVPNGDQKRVRLQLLERGGALALLASLALLHGRMLFHAGALWRDEINTLNVAGKATFHEFWSALEFDSYPALWPLLLRGWLSLGGGADDFHLRLVGCAIGLCVVAALWWNSRLFSRGASWPFVSWLLLGASPVLFKWGDSLRAYGFGTLLSLVALGMIWKLIEHPSRRTLALATLFALLSVHALYYNSILLLALCASGTAVGVRRRDWKIPARLLAVGLLCALSLMIYLPHIAGARDWGKLIQVPVSAPWLMQRLGVALRASGGAMPAVWAGLWAGALGGCALCWRSKAECDGDRALFLGGILCLVPLLFLSFLKVLSYPTTDWYYLSLMGFLAVGIDAAWQVLVDDWPSAKMLRTGGCALVAAAMALPAWRSAGQRRTTVDRAAAVLEDRASSDDLIVVTNWTVGIAFLRYFHGSTPWVTLPEIPDHTLHRYDLIAQRMEEADPLDDVLQRSADILEAGHRVWILGELPLQKEAPQPLPPAPRSPSGWQERAYTRRWQAQAAYFLRVHAAQIETVLPPLPMEQVDNYENLPLSVASGWR